MPGPESVPASTPEPGAVASDGPPPFGAGIVVAPAGNEAKAAHEAQRGCAGARLVRAPF